jgi:hypothetical protein
LRRNDNARQARSHFDDAAITEGTARPIEGQVGWRVAPEHLDGELMGRGLVVLKPPRGPTMLYIVDSLLRNSMIEGKLDMVEPDVVAGVVACGREDDHLAQ